ncbi:Periodic tryptophan protein 1 like protein [Aduncisulcus paluster]|uniref:Periodic tryptophan protein 1 like protein n=1 Tax=Aduncisulcus paluster TaxID=2918883 RepID=A0ABQ5K435_9EUKA|nr:Periodic tryptophan protein 1 like protein [Aduncisulcus paluster]
MEASSNFIFCAKWVPKKALIQALRQRDRAFIDPSRRVTERPEEESESQDDPILLHSTGLVTDPELDPYLSVGPEEEEPEFLLNPESDTAICALRVSDSQSAYITYMVYDHTSHHTFLHHDLPLAHLPTAITWISHKSLGENLCGVSTFGKGGSIEIWDLSVMDEICPLMTLGGFTDKETVGKEEWERLMKEAGLLGVSTKDYTTEEKAQHKKKLQRIRKKISKFKASLPSHEANSHTDTVTCIEWNKKFPHFLCSCSADCSIKLWDITAEKEEDKCVATVIPSPCSDKVTTDSSKTSSKTKGRDEEEEDIDLTISRGVHSICWDKQSGMSVFYGCGNTIGVCDFNEGKERVIGTMESDCECISSTESGIKDKELVLAGDDQGGVYAWLMSTTDTSGGSDEVCIRFPRAHSTSVTSVSTCPQCPNILMTASEDKSVKIWAIVPKDSKYGDAASVSHQLNLLYTREMHECGRVLGASWSDEMCGVVCVSGFHGTLCVFNALSQCDKKIWEGIADKKERFVVEFMSGRKDSSSSSSRGLGEDEDVEDGPNKSVVSCCIVSEKMGDDGRDLDDDLKDEDDESESSEEEEKTKKRGKRGKKGGRKKGK